MTVTLTTAGRLLLRTEITYSTEGYTYCVVRAPHVRGTLTFHPEADPGRREDPDAYTGLCVTFGQYDPAKSPSGYRDQMTVYGSRLYGSVSLRTVAPSHRSGQAAPDPWSTVHRNPYELAEAPARTRIKDVGEALVKHHLASPERHKQHAAYLRHIAATRADRIAAETDHLRSSVHLLARMDALRSRWAVLSDPTAVQGIDVTVNGTLADWLDQQFSGQPAIDQAEQQLYLAWTAAVRFTSPYGTVTHRRVTLPGTQGAAALIHHLNYAAAHAPGRTAPAGARSILRRLAARRTELAPLITIPEQRQPAA